MSLGSSAFGNLLSNRSVVLSSLDDLSGLRNRISGVENHVGVLGGDELVDEQGV